MTRYGTRTPYRVGRVARYLRMRVMACASSGAREGNMIGRRGVVRIQRPFLDPRSRFCAETASRGERHRRQPRKALLPLVTSRTCGGTHAGTAGRVRGRAVCACDPAFPLPRWSGRYSVRKLYGAITVCKCTVTSTFSPMRTVSDTDFIRTHAGSCDGSLWLMAHGGCYTLLGGRSGAESVTFGAAP